MPSTSMDHNDAHHAHSQGSSSTTTTTIPPPPAPIQAPPITPPPLYALVTPGLHRCSAIGLEEELNEAWSSVQSLGKEVVEMSVGVGATSSGSSGSSAGAGASASGSISGSTTGPSASTTTSTSTTTTQSGTTKTTSPSASTSPSPSTSHPTPTLPLSILSHSPLLSFLSTLHLRTLIYLSPSLLPASLLKLCRDLNLSLLQWDLQGGRLWRVREGCGDEERRALFAFVGTPSQQQQQEGGEEQEDDGEGQLTGLDLTKMCKATLELLLNVHSNGVLLCDPSGLSETSLVIGCLRRMMRWNFASVCLEYRAFAPSRLASTANHLRFVELFPLNQLQLPHWDHLVPWAARGLRSVQKQEREMAETLVH